ADFHLRPSAARLAAAAAALARLHLAWRPSLGVAGPSPGVRARLRSIVRWRALAAGRAGPDVRQHPALAAPAARGWRAVAADADRAERVLREWEGRPVPTQPCLRDVWGAPVLFTGEAGTGPGDHGPVHDRHGRTAPARGL